MNSLSGDDYVHNALSDELARLTASNRFTVAEFGDHGATVLRVYRDRNGTPQAEEPRLSASVMDDPDAFYREVAPAFIARTAPRLPDELSHLLPGPGGVPVCDCLTPLKEHVREAMRDSPLALGYELAVLKRVPPGRSGAGRIYISGQQLFPPGVSRGHQVSVRVRVEPTDRDGTVFAVVTREPRPDVPPNSRELQPVQLLSAVVAPGSYELRAVLARPGRVQFEGLPASATLGRSARSWDDLKRLVPEQIRTSRPAHLVCLVEVCGGDQRLQPRIDRLEQLITAAESSTRPLVVSVVAYGAHAVAWAVDDEPIDVRAWAAPSAQAITELRGLIGRKEDEREYYRAAQLECALQEVARRLSDKDGQPVLVTAGGRPAHPSAMDTRSQIIPCPGRVSASTQLNRLRRVPVKAYGALRDQGWRGDIWQSLGREAAATVDDAVDMGDFAAALGLREAAQIVPFPFIDA